MCVRYIFFAPSSTCGRIVDYCLVSALIWCLFISHKVCFTAREWELSEVHVARIWICLTENENLWAMRLNHIMRSLAPNTSRLYHIKTQVIQRQMKMHASTRIEGEHQKRVQIIHYLFIMRVTFVSHSPHTKKKRKNRSIWIEPLFRLSRLIICFWCKHIVIFFSFFVCVFTFEKRKKFSIGRFTNTQLCAVCISISDVMNLWSPTS